MSLPADGSNRIDVEQRRAMHSGEYVRSFEHKPMSRLARLLPRMRLRNADSVVDLACGNAMLLELIHASVARYHGVDFSADFINAAEARAQRLGARNAQFSCEDIEAFCTAHPEAFDVATAMDFTEHIYDDDMLRMFSAARKSLKPGGRLYVHTPNRDFFLELMKQHGLFPQFREHIAVRNEEGTVNLLERCGFERSRIHVTHLPHYNILRLLEPMTVLPVIGKSFRARLFIECER